MLKEEKKAIDNIDKRLTIEKYTKNIATPVYISDLEKNLNLIQLQQELINSTECLYKKDLDDLVKAKKGNKKKDKIIDLMAEELSIQYNSCEPCELSEKDHIICKDYKKCKECIKQYFEKKVEGK